MCFFVPPFAIVCDLHTLIIRSRLLLLLLYMRYGSSEDYPTIRLNVSERRAKQVSLLESFPISLVLAATWSIFQRQGQ